jgi:PAT family beta-lactamase induction signal transducer AmpG
MNQQAVATRRHPFTWVPTLYFAEGLPLYAVYAISPILYKRLGLANDTIAFYTSLPLWAWTLKPLWSPLVEKSASKKTIAVATQIIGGALMAGAGLCLPLPAYFAVTMSLLAVIAVVSATHDIAADGVYIAALSKSEQAAYAGAQGAFYNAARLFSQGGLITLAGLLGDHTDAARSTVVHAWMGVFMVMGATLAAVGAYHIWALPQAQRVTADSTEEKARFSDVIASFFKKPSIWLMIIFILLYRAGEGQVQTVGRLFLIDSRANGGLGLTNEQYGAIYGIFATIAFIGGSILGGLFASKLGLRRALLPLICAMNLPNLAFVYLSVAQPTNSIFVTIAMSLEMFGYGFGFIGVILLMMQEVAPGPYQTAHYAFCTGFMNLGLQIAAGASGWIQVHLGSYQRFFIWVLVSAIPALILSRLIPFRNTQEVPAIEPPAA